MVKYCISWIGLLCWAVALAHASSEQLSEKSRLRSDNNSSSPQICGCYHRFEDQIMKYQQGRNPSVLVSLNSLFGLMNDHSLRRFSMDRLRIMVDALTHVFNSSIYLHQRLGDGIHFGHLGPKETQEAHHKLEQFWIKFAELLLGLVRNGSLHNLGSHEKSLLNLFTQYNNILKFMGLNESPIQKDLGIFGDLGQYDIKLANSNHSWSHFLDSMTGGGKFYGSGSMGWTDFDNYVRGFERLPENLSLNFTGSGPIDGGNSWSGLTNSSIWIHRGNGRSNKRVSSNSSSSSSEFDSDTESTSSDESNNSS